MEMPRRRAGSYEPRSNVGNVLAPVSGPQGSADLRTTPSARGLAAAVVSRPPWATELDAADASKPSQPQNPSSGRSSSNIRGQPRSAGGQADREPHGFSFHASPAPVGGTTVPHDLSGPWPGTSPAPGRPPSGGRMSPGPVPVDQLDLWSRQQQQQQGQQQGQHGASQGRRSDGLHARVDHTPAVAAPAGATARRGSGSGDSDGAQRLPGGDLSCGDVAPRTGVGMGRAGGAVGRAGASAGGGVARAGASPARTAPAAAADGRAAAARSSSIHKPRPAAPPKRSTSITDNVPRGWVDSGTTPERRAGGRAGGSAGGVGHWDANADSGDRGSWLFAGDAEPQRDSKSPAPDPDLRPVSDRRRHPERPASADRGANIYDNDGSDGGGKNPRCNSPGVPERNQLPTPSSRRQRPHPPSAGDLHSTVSLAAAAPSAIGGSMSLGHGVSAGLATGAPGASSTAGATTAAGRSGGRQGGLATNAESARQIQALQEENARLRDQVQHLERLLAATATTPAAEEAVSGSRKGITAAAAAGRPWSATSTAEAAAAAPSLAAAAAGGVALRQYKSQAIQLQRQVALMSQEIEARSRLSFEAEGALREMAARLEDLAADSGIGAGGGGAGVVPGGAPAALPGAAAEAAAGLGSGIGGGGDGHEVLSRDRLMALHKWSKQMLGRLRGEKSESSKLFTQQAADSRASGGFGGRGGGGGLGFRTPSRGDRGGGGGGSYGGDFSGSCAPSWLVPFIPAGGNRFLMAAGDAAAAAVAATADDLAAAAGGGGAAAAAAVPSIAAIAGGHAVLLADPLLAHRLEVQLAAVAPRLAAVAVLLRTQVLPAMPWLGLEAADRLQAEVGEAAEGVAQAVAALVQLCSLLPAGAAAFGEGPAAVEPRRRAAEVDAGRDSWLYGSSALTDALEPPSPAVNDEGVISVPRLQAAIMPLLRDRKIGGKALMEILEAARSRSQAAAAKRALLELELQFAARAAALQSEHVSHLMLSVGMALEECRGAKDAVAIKSYFNAAAAVRQVLETADALEMHPCESCLKALVDVVRLQREPLNRVPELLLNAPAADVEGQLLAKVEQLHTGFKKAISRLEAHKRRHLDAVAGGGGSVATGAGGGTIPQGADSDHEDDNEDNDDDANDGAARVRRLPPSSASTEAPAVKPVKPPKPRPEWQG